MTKTVTCDAFTTAKIDGKNHPITCDAPEGHGGRHLDKATGHAWTAQHWSRRQESADGRYVIDVYERRSPMFEPWETNPNYHDADEERIETYEAERGNMVRKLNVPLTRFAEATRLYVGGRGWDALVGADAPADDRDDVAWAHYYAAELEAITTAIEAAARTLAERGFEIPPHVSDYMRSRYAGCLMCSCSPGMVCRDVLRPPGGGRPVDISITVRSDAEIAADYAAA